MNVNETWKRLGTERLEQPIEDTLQPNRQSQHPVAKLKNNYLIKTVMMIVFLLVFVALFLSSDKLFMQTILGILVFAYTIFLAGSFSMYKSIRTELFIGESMLTFLTKTKEYIERALRFERISSLLIFPFAGTAGYMLGYKFSGGSIDRLFKEPVQIAVLVVTLIVFGVLGYIAGNRLTREGYGKSLKEIEEMIRQLKTA